MKSILKAFAAFFLAALARGVLKKYRPMVVMVTGSVGKTSTKDAVAAALAPSFYLWKSEKSYNSEVGVPLTIIGAKNAWGSVSGWFKVFRQGLALIALPSHYPKLLVLEVGADRPGDLAKILRIVTPDVVVVTKLPDVPVHVEAYASPEAVREEEFAPAYALPVGAPLIISSDNSYAPEMASRLPARVITYGANTDATVFIDTPELYMEDGVPAGMHAKVTIDTKTYELRAVGVTGRPQIYAPAAALATACALGVNPTEALAGLEAYEPPPGRGRLLAGLRGSVLIDDSYNSSPTASEEALASLALIPHATRRIAVLGDMLELGR
jgi:UDP-N-acetylmuramoyl-tripeptide--D-alanyl-D-alanine ligase